jgi:hypothetical protein
VVAIGRLLWIRLASIAGPLIVSIAKTIVHSLYDSREKGSNIDATVRSTTGTSRTAARQPVKLTNL